MFKPIEKEIVPYPNKYYEIIIAEISDMVATGKLKSGDVLPSERELAECFQTSRVPVREALKILEFLGLVRHVSGKGMVIQTIEISSLLSKVFFGMNISEGTKEQLLDIRFLLEPYAAEQAAYTATEEDLEQIRKALHEADEMSPTDRSMDFHSAVIHASHNAILEELYKFLISLLRQFRATSLEDRYNEGPLLFHSKIYTAIANRQGVSARYLMRAHLEDEKVHSICE